MSEVIENAIILIDDNELTQYAHVCPECGFVFGGTHTLEKNKIGQLKVFKNVSVCPKCNKKYFGVVEIK